MFDPFVKLFHEGGWVLFPIFGVSVMVWHIIIGKLFQIRSLAISRKRMRRLLFSSAAKTQPVKTGHIAFDSFVKSIRKPPYSTIQIERACDDLLMAAGPSVNRGISTISAGIMMAPLLGLLGTISGMNEMFSIIGEFGFGNPAIMANGISMALQATLTGLAVAVTALFFLDKIKTSQLKFFAGLREDRDALLQIAAKTLTPQPSAQPEGDTMHPRISQLHDDHQNPEINLAPFVDTIMILLIFFVVTANLYIETGVTVSRPRAQSATPAGQKAILVGITREGTIHLYGRQTSPERLRAIMEQEVGKQPDVSVVIIADRDGSVGKTVEVIDQCTLAGVQKVSIAANRDR